MEMDVALAAHVSSCLYKASCIYKLVSAETWFTEVRETFKLMSISLKSAHSHKLFLVTSEILLPTQKYQWNGLTDNIFVKVGNSNEIGRKGNKN